MSDAVLKTRPGQKFRRGTEANVPEDEKSGLDDKLFQEASRRAGDRILAFTQHLADELGADPLKDRGGE